MGPILSLVDNATNNLIPGGTPYPSFLLGAAHLLNQIHWLWCWKHQYLTVYSNANNFKKYAGGCLINAVVGNNDLLRSAAQVVLITRRILDCGKQKVVVYRAWTEVVKSWNIDYKKQVRVEISTSLQDAGFLEQMVDEETYIWIKKTQEAVVLCVLHVGEKLKFLCWELLQLSVCYRLVIEAMSLNPTVRDAAVNELLLHSSEIFENISANRKMIHQELCSNKALIQKIMTTMHMPISADSLIEGVGQSLETAEAVYSAAGRVYTAVEDTGRQGLWMAMHSSIGWAPAWLLPAQRG